MTKPRQKNFKMKYNKNKTMTMTKKLELTKMKRKTFLGNSMMRTMKEWFLYKKNFYAICNTRQGSPPVGCYLTANRLWMFSVMQGC